MTPPRSSLPLLLAAALTACTAVSPDPLGTPLPTAGAPALVVRAADGTLLSFEELCDRLAHADVVFLGETHLDESTHQTELAIYRALLARRGDVVLALEMFERDVQPRIDDYLAGRIDEPTFLAGARPWGNYRTAYRPLVEAARAAGQPVVASNFPRPLLGEVARAGLDALAAAPPGVAPSRVFANTSAYHRRTDNAVRGHLGMMGGPRPPEDERLTSTQTLWDNAMGEACATALRANPGAQVVHVNGGFHSAYHDGTVRQFQLREPDARVLTVSIAPVSAPGVAAITPSSAPPVADFVAFVPQLARDNRDGTFGVHVPKELDYELVVPPHAGPDAPVPLLVWLTDDGLTARDGRALVEGLLGDACALLVLEPPYRELAADLAESGRWYWVDDFTADFGTASAALEQALGFALRHFPIDPERVVVAGEGTGATVAAATTLFADTPRTGVAIGPRRYAKIRDFPLPLPEYAGHTAARSLVVLGDEGDEAWWNDELAQYADVELPGSFAREPADPWARELGRENALRRALGLDARTLDEGAPVAYAVAPADTPRARDWARRYALGYGREHRVPATALRTPRPVEGRSTELSLAVDRDALARGEGLPRCPGPFGGTTVLVVEPDQLSDWLVLEERDPLNAESRFHRVRIATTGADRALGDVLTKLADERRTNALIVPATFYASPAQMAALARVAEPLEDRMTLHWQPGLGGARLGDGT